MKRLLFFLMGLILFCNCEREKFPQVMILVTSNDTLTNCKPSDSILFHIHSSAVDDVVKNVTITSFDAKLGSILLLDTLLNVEKSEFDYLFIVPQYTDTIETELTFKAFSQNKLSTSSYSISLGVVANRVEDSIIVHHQNLFMYGCGHAQSGFDLENLTNLVQDISTTDIYDLCDPSDTTYLLSRIWGSHTGISFVRFNDFDYDAATVASIKNVYNSAQKSDYIYDVEQDDIIFVGRNNLVLGVIQVRFIYDVLEGQNNRYVFNYKKIER